MRWVVEGNETVSLDERQLTNLLFAELSQAQKPDLEKLTSQLCGFLQNSQVIAGMNAYDVAHTAALLGYYYRIFLSNNKVTLEENDTPGDVVGG